MNPQETKPSVDEFQLDYLKERDFLSRHSFTSSLSFYFKSSGREITRRKTFYCLALLSCVLVVMTTAVAQSVVDNAPLIFLKQAQRTSGEIDVLIYSHKYPRNESFTEFGPEIQKLFGPDSPVRQEREILLNGTVIEQTNQLNIHADISYRYTQRINLIGGKENNSSCFEALKLEESGDYEGVYSPNIMKNCAYKEADLVLLNTARENEVGPGTIINPRIPAGSAIIDKSIAEMLGVRVGEQFLIQFFVDAHMEYIAEDNEEFFTAQTGCKPQDVSNIFIRFPVKVYQIWNNFASKLPDGGQTCVLMEQETFYAHAVKYFPDRWSPILKNTTEFFKRKLADLNLTEYSNNVIVNHPHRMKVYTDPNLDTLRFTIEKFAEQTALALGVLPFEMRLDLLESLEPLKFAVLFLGILLNVIIMVLFGQSVMVIYNLLLVKVETKTFEMGVLRTLGLSQTGIIELIIVQTLIFVIPAICLGLLSSIPFLSIIGEFLKEKLHADIDATPSLQNIFYACLVGLLVPVVSSIAPLISASGQSLVSALDTVHSKATSVFIDIQSGSKKLPWVRITFSLLTITLGVAIYYLLPLSLLSFNVGLILSIFFWILLGMLLGLVLLSMNVQHLVERNIVRILFCFASDSFRNLVVKNLVTHKIRNQKTATMYALTLGFIILLVVGYSSIIDSLEIVNKQSVGAQIEITLGNACYNLPGNGDYLQIDKFLNSKNMSEVVDSFAWITCGLREVVRMNEFQAVEVTNIGRFYSENADIFGVTPNIFDVGLKEFYKPGIVNESSSYYPTEELYSIKGSQSGLVSEHFRVRCKTE